MDPRLKKAIVAASLGAFAVETTDLVFHQIKIGHGLPSAMQMASSSTTASTTTVFVVSFGNAITEAVYPGVPDTKLLKGGGQIVLPSS